MILQSMPSRWFPLVSILVITLLLSACSTQKPFYSFAPSTNVPQSTVAPLVDSVTSPSPAVVVTTPVVVPESYPLLASTAAPTPALLLATSRPRPQPVVVRPSAIQATPAPAPYTTQENKQLTPHKFARKADKTPLDKGIHTMVTLSLLFGFAALLVGLIGIGTILSGGWTLLTLYGILALLGLSLSIFALSRINANPSRATYDKDRRAAKFGLFLSLVPAAILLLLFLAVAMG
jgi:hypothetical protein